MDHSELYTVKNLAIAIQQHLLAFVSRCKTCREQKDGVNITFPSLTVSSFIPVFFNLKPFMRSNRRDIKGAMRSQRTLLESKPLALHKKNSAIGGPFHVWGTKHSVKHVKSSSPFLPARVSFGIPARHFTNQKTASRQWRIQLMKTKRFKISSF